MGKQNRTAISPTRSEDYPQWYQQVIKAADLAEVSPVRGCMVIKPWGWSIWENMQQVLDGMFKDTGHVNAYFPLFIPMSFLEKEAEHVDGFAKECAVVTHHRLEPGPDGGLVPAGPLEEPLIVRPTSETIIGSMYAKWVQSYRDLPIKINQWANVVRWEMRTRMFLRTAEFLWQEGHTCHATEEEALEETRLMLDVYADFAENVMAMPVIKGEKTVDERFPGAVSTLTIEAMMQDFKALQAGTSHFLGQNFSKAQEIVYQDQQGEQQFAWTTSWGVSTRLVGALIMTHSDDDGLVLPPRLAPKQIVILPIIKGDETKQQVLDFCDALKQDLESQFYADGKIRVLIDDRDMRGGEKKWYHVKRGVPIRVEVGPRDIENNQVFVGRRDTGSTESIGRDEFVSGVVGLLESFQQGLFDRALKLREENTREINSLEEFEAYFSEKDGQQAGFASCHFVEGEQQVLETIAKYKVTIRCMPLDQPAEQGTCIFTGKPSSRRAIFGRSY
ncbi:MAG: proline--tRNA ligase [Planctomycetaceae bacterium]|nr:proline--tRNA ligase [Planctomycetaceae bacterium]|tara:strand:+ start:2152 stop:3657 length:1506 start_codon:yes stop_codon:yes gene_type:complete